MAVIKTCRICGKEYPACKSDLGAPGEAFRWRTVACSPKCASEYYRRLLDVPNKSDEEIAATVKAGMGSSYVEAETPKAGVNETQDIADGTETLDTKDDE